MQVKAIACELPGTRGLPLSRLSAADIVREAQRSGIVATLSDKTVWRWLNDDAIRPWQRRTWIFPRDPQFIPKAAFTLCCPARAGRVGDAGGLVLCGRLDAVARRMQPSRMESAEKPHCSERSIETTVRGSIPISSTDL